MYCVVRVRVRALQLLPFLMCVTIPSSRVSGVFWDKSGPGGRGDSGAAWDSLGPQETWDPKDNLYVVTLEQTMLPLVYLRPEG